MPDKSPSRVLVTSGPTRAYIDRVRYIANTSSGALGARIVEELLRRDIPVVHLYGTGSEHINDSFDPRVRPIEVVSVDDLVSSVKKVVDEERITAVVHAMAVLDYVPATVFEGKKASGDDSWMLLLEKTPKVIGIMRELLPDACFVGFKLEAGAAEQELIRKATLLMRKNTLDLVVANDLDKVRGENHSALLIVKGGRIIARPESKRDIAVKIADFITGECR